MPFNMQMLQQLLSNPQFIQQIAPLLGGGAGFNPQSVSGGPFSVPGGGMQPGGDSPFQTPTRATPDRGQIDPQQPQMATGGGIYAGGRPPAPFTPLPPGPPGPPNPISVNGGGVRPPGRATNRPVPWQSQHAESGAPGPLVRPVKPQGPGRGPGPRPMKPKPSPPFNPQGDRSQVNLTDYKKKYGGSPPFYPGR